MFLDNSNLLHGMMFFLMKNAHLDETKIQGYIGGDWARDNLETARLATSQPLSVCPVHEHGVFVALTLLIGFVS